MNVLKLIKPNCGVYKAFKIAEATEESGASTCLVAQAALEEVIFQGKRPAEQEQGPSEAGGRVPFVTDLLT